MSTEPLPLTVFESTLIIALQSREREINREVILPLQNTFNELLDQIETRLNLAPGEIRVRYELDAPNCRLLPRAVPANLPESE